MLIVAVQPTRGKAPTYNLCGRYKGGSDSLRRPWPQWGAQWGRPVALELQEVAR